MLRPGGLFLLFAHVRDEAPGPEGRWITVRQIDELFQPGFVVERLERGTTTVGDNTWPSAWYWLRRWATADQPKVEQFAAIKAA